MKTGARVVAATGVVVVLLVASGCSKNLMRVTGVADQPPVVTLTSTHAGSADAQSAEHRLTWTATDPDGRVVRYLVTTSLAALRGESEGWVATTDQSRTLQARRAVSGAARAVAGSEPEFDVFAVRAVDDQGAVSKAAALAFFGENVAPTVRITQPTPSALLTAVVTPQVHIVWEGADPDGHPERPAMYKYKLFKLDGSIPWQAWLVEPDSLRRQFAPTFPGWDSLDGKETELTLSGLQVAAEYLFVITAFDKEGAYDPVFSLAKNMLRMSVSGATWPQITIYNEFINWTQVLPGPSAPELVLLGYGPFTFHWVARSVTGATITGYRWAVDPTSLGDGPGAREAGWSRWDPDLTSATFSCDSGETHTLYVEARDSNGGIALAALHLRFVLPTFAKDLLIVNDTRFTPDMRPTPMDPAHPDSVRAPSGLWPSAAELDTFLYAVGGVRWRMTPNGTLSPAGVFKGYRLDTLGTRYGKENPTIPLELLAQYRHVVWMVDPLGSLNSPDYNGGWPTSMTFPMTTLRYMSTANHENTLATWLAGGGKLWALGGGFGNATSAPWNNPANDDSRGPVYSSLGTRPDLVPGRFMYDWTHWQSEFRVSRLTGGRFVRADRYTTNPEAIPVVLPATLAPRSPATDPLPPNRTVSSFYNPTYGLEYLTRPNHIDGPKNPSPRHAEDVQLMDTLMVAANALLPPLPDSSGSGVAACMTWYHGQDGVSVVFSGFDIWTWPRVNCRGLVDGVLGGIWGLSRDAAASGPTASRTQRKRD